MSSVEVSFPQPEVEEPLVGVDYYFAHYDGSIGSYRWLADKNDFRILNSSQLYLTRIEAEQRADWNKQEMTRLVKPMWARDLGPDVQIMKQGDWKDFDPERFIREGGNWGKSIPARFRAKPKSRPEVVVTVCGKEYRWPATVEHGDPPGPRYICVPAAFGQCFEVVQGSSSHGNRTHSTREGADAQCAAINAAIGL